MAGISSLNNHYIFQINLNFIRKSKRMTFKRTITEIPPIFNRIYYLRQKAFIINIATCFNPSLMCSLMRLKKEIIHMNNTAGKAPA